ncbi:hypothetical protein G6R40_10730 [Chryseobacterium sp. POL2]|uniref:hypothetical protein n=1 Tax=Chryseobacterium sp. POL2 TaxID=2713414 RepID=UPI0013E1AFA0|nr:hypothetical protein [Chryseobacterium sp. POL2]QIG90104.1 hypothetical protein G6R40_10730 [Chryseobacterium sp. POL2]
MKNLMLLIFLIAASCSKKAPETTMSEKPEVLDYDTTAIDSFAPGATPANMLPKVIKVKDSAKEAKKKVLEAQIKELEKKELEKKKAEEKQKTKDKEKQKALETSLPTEQSAI